MKGAVPALGIQADNRNDMSLEAIVEAVCCRMDTTIEDIRSDKRVKQLVLARAVMAKLIQKFKVGTMKDLGQYVSRDTTSLAKLSRKYETDIQTQTITKELSVKLISQNQIR